MRAIHIPCLPEFRSVPQSTLFFTSETRLVYRASPIFQSFLNAGSDAKKRQIDVRQRKDRRVRREDDDRRWVIEANFGG